MVTYIIIFGILALWPQSTWTLYPIRNPDSSVNIDSLVAHVTELEKFMAESAGHVTELNTVKHELANLKTKTQSRETEFTNLKKQFQSRGIEIRDLKNELASLKAQNNPNDTLNSLEDVKSELASVKADLVQTQAQLQSQQQHILMTQNKSHYIEVLARNNSARIKDEIPAFRTEFISLKGELRMAESDIEDLKKTVTVNVSSDVKANTEEIATLKFQMNSTERYACKDLETDVYDLGSRLNSTNEMLEHIRENEQNALEAFKTQLYANFTPIYDDYLNLKLSAEVAVNATVYNQHKTDKQVKEVKALAQSLARALNASITVKEHEYNITVSKLETSIASIRTELNQTNNGLMTATADGLVEFRVSSTSPYHIEHPDPYILNHDSTEINKGGHYDSSNGIFTAPSQGLYVFWLKTNVAIEGDGIVSLRIIDDHDNSVLSVEGVHWHHPDPHPPGPQSPLSLYTSAVVYLTKGDSVHFELFTEPHEVHLNVLSSEYGGARIQI